MMGASPIFAGRQAGRPKTPGRQRPALWGVLLERPPGEAKRGGRDWEHNVADAEFTERM